jgi:hypothetical protein
LLTRHCKKKQPELIQPATVDSILTHHHCKTQQQSISNRSGLVGWMVIYCFTSCSSIFHLYGGATITDEELQNLGLSSALSAFEQGGIFIMQHLL